MKANLPVISFFLCCFSLSNLKAQTSFFDYTGGDQSYTVPVGVSTITIKMWGAGGGGGENGSDGGVGGGGAYVTGTLCVTPGATFTVVVGGGGGAGGNATSKSNVYGGGGASRDRPWDGGGGGGRTALRRNSTGVEVAIAGAGAGGGSRGNRAGGAGGGVGANGGKGDNCGSYGRGGNADGTVPGGGNNSSGTAWNSFVGGSGGNAEQLNSDNSGGGGGGGFGGGQGGCTGGNDSGGGGGGSSRLDGFTASGTLSGSGQAAGNAGDGDNGNQYGRGGNRNTFGQNGRVVIRVTPGTSLGAISGTPSACFNGSTQLSNATAGGTWGSNNTNIANVSGTGLVSGVAAGQATITYTLTTACGTQSVSQLVTITGLPTVAAITGTQTACVNGTTQFSNTTAGGMWSSDNTGVADVNSAGLVSGVSVGGATISYAVSGTCGTTTVSRTVNVTATPSLPAITGIPSACVGATTQLANSISGGTWSSNNTNVASVNSASGLVAGEAGGQATITYSVTDNCGTTTATQLVTINTVPVVQPISGVFNVCVGATTQLANATPNGVWSNNNNNATVSNTGLVSGVAAGTTTISYAVTGTCGTTTISENITVDALPILPAITGTLTICIGATSQLSNTVSGGTWNSGSQQIASIDVNSGLANGIASGASTITYTATVNGCTSFTQATLNVSPLPVVTSATPTDVLCNGGNTGSIVVAGGSGTPPYTYSINNGQSFQNNTTFNGLIAASYTVAISDALGCSAAFAFNPVTVGEPNVISQTNTIDTASCANVFDGKITVNVTGGTQPYSYSLNGGATQPGNIFSGLLAGNYTVQVIDAKGCTNVSNETIDTAFSVTASIVAQTPVTCFGAANGSVEVQLSGGLQPYAYSINGVQFVASPIFSGLSSGNYLITLRDSKGCTDFVSVNIAEPAAVSIALDSVANVLCGGDSTGSIFVTATGGTAPFLFAWNNGLNTEDISGVKAGTYKLTVTDANSCTGTVTANVSQPLQLFAIVASYQDVLCSGDSSGYVDISVSGGTPPYNFDWNTGATTEDITKLVDGVYTITVADNNGCSISVTKQLTQPAALQVTSNATNAVCFGDAGSIDVTTTGGAQPYKFVWSNGATTEDLQSVSAGAYILTVTDNNNCSKQVVTTVSSATAISIAGVVTNTSCTGGNIGAVDISVTGGSGNYTYQWSSNAGSATSQDVTGLSAGIYTVTVTDASLCTQVASFEVVATSNQIIADLAEVNPVCSDGNNGFITVFVTGGTAPYIYIWSNGQTKNTASNLTSGTYTVTITDAKGCSTTANGVIVEPQPIDISVLTTGSKCSNIGSGAVNVSVLGGKAPFTYQLNGVVQSSNEFGNLLPGNYTIMVRDANGCEAVTSITIEQSSVYSVSLSADKILILSGMESQLTAKVISDAPVLNYFWSPLGSLSYEGCGDTLNCPNPKVAPSVTTIYTVTVLNADSCITSDTVFIAVSNQPSTFFPTAFTPNGDGLNDRFEFDILGAKSADVSIYNRWGNLVFASPDQPNGISNKDGWDGSFKGKLLEYDTYVYSIVVGYFDGAEKRFTGTVALMK